MTQEIKAIILDVDGVVLKSKDYSGKYLWSCNIKNDLGIKSKHFKEIFHEDKWAKVTKGLLDTKKHLSNTLAKFPELKVNAEQFIEYWLKHDNFVDDEVVKLFKRINLPIYLATNQDKYRTAYIKKIIGHYFSGVFSSCEIGFLKPEEEFYKHVEQKLLLNSKNLLLIDDTLVNIVAAKKYGWKAYHHSSNSDRLHIFLNEVLSIN